MTSAEPSPLKSKTVELVTFDESSSVSTRHSSPLPTHSAGIGVTLHAGSNTV